MMRNETQACDESETSAHPSGVCNAPKDLTPELGMSCDAGDACFVHTEAWFLNGGDFEEVKGCWVEEEEGEEGEEVDGGMHKGEGLDGPELGAVVTVGDEVGDEEDGGGEGEDCKENAVQTLSGVGG